MRGRSSRNQNAAEKARSSLTDGSRAGAFTRSEPIHPVRGAHRVVLQAVSGVADPDVVPAAVGAARHAEEEQAGRRVRLVAQPAGGREHAARRRQLLEPRAATKSVFEKNQV